MAITDEKSLYEAADRLLATGLKRAFISLGDHGILAAEGSERVLRGCCPAQMRNATGAGDTAMAALAWAYLEGQDLSGSAAAACAAAAIAAEGAETINPELDADAVRRRMKD